MEEAIPIGVSSSFTKSAREVYTVNPKAMRDKAELTKEEKQKERAHRKRQIKSHLKHKEIRIKEKIRDQGLGQSDRFALKQVKEQMAKKKKVNKQDKELGLLIDKNENAYKSGQFFKNMSGIQKKDKEKKDLKREAKAKGVAMESFHKNGSAKRFKM